MSGKKFNPAAIAQSPIVVGITAHGMASGPPAARSGELARQRDAPFGATGLAAGTSALSPWSGLPKRAMDLFGAAALLLLATPLMALIALLIGVTEGGPVLIGHTRIGRGGTKFKCLKFRTMVVDAERVLAQLLTTDLAAREEWQRTRKLREDPRVTRLGRILRASSLDEMPQLFNVLRGEMSLVGPRPVIAAEIADHYGYEAAAYYCAVRPGITGPWQVSGRSTRCYAERIALDVDYVRRMSLSRDAAILLRTVMVVLSRRGAY